MATLAEIAAQRLAARPRTYLDRLRATFTPNELHRAKVLEDALAKSWRNVEAKFGNDVNKWPDAVIEQAENERDGLMKTLATAAELPKFSRLWDAQVDAWDIGLTDEEMEANYGKADAVNPWPIPGEDSTDAAMETKYGPDGMQPKPQPSPPAPEQNEFSRLEFQNLAVPFSRVPVSPPKRTPAQPPSSRPARQSDSTRAKIAQERLDQRLGKAIFSPLRKNADEMPSIDNRKPMYAVSETIDLADEAGERTR